MIEWIGIICCSSIISCMCSLLTTSFCLSPTGGRLREKLKKPIKTQNQDEFPQRPRLPEDAKNAQDEEIFKEKSRSNFVVPQTSSVIRSHTHFGKNEPIEWIQNQSKIREGPRQSIDLSIENFDNSSAFINSTNPTTVSRNIPTESEIRQTIDEFNSVFQQYNELISKNTRQDFKKQQSSVKFQVPDTSQETSNVGTMTEQENCQFCLCKLNSKIKKCKCKNNEKVLGKNKSTQSVRSVKSCTCSARKSKSDLYPRNAASLKNVDRSNSKHPLDSKSSWISKTMKKFRLKGDRKKNLKYRLSNDSNPVSTTSETQNPFQ